MVFDARLRTPLNSIITGGSKSGKTSLIARLVALSKHLFVPVPARSILFYKYKQPVYIELLSAGKLDELIEIKHSLSAIDILKKVSPYKKDGSLVIIDDSISNLAKDFEDVFTKISHHNNCSIFIISQMLFRSKDHLFRTLSLNTHYMFVMKNERDKQQIRFLAHQICPGDAKYIIQSYVDATQKPYSYLLLDFTQECPDELRLRTNILPEEFPYAIYKSTKDL
jgi:hypothetical protein